MYHPWGQLCRKSRPEKTLPQGKTVAIRRFRETCVGRVDLCCREKTKTVGVSRYFTDFYVRICIFTVYRQAATLSRTRNRMIIIIVTLL